MEHQPPRKKNFRKRSHSSASDADENKLEDEQEDELERRFVLSRFSSKDRTFTPFFFKF